MRSTKPKTDFGIEVSIFTAKTGISVKELAELSGVKYSTLIETTTGRCAGHQLIPIVRRFMADYELPAAPLYPETEARA